MAVQPPSTFHVFYSCIFIIVKEQNFLFCLLDWGNSLHCPHQYQKGVYYPFANCRNESSYSFESFDSYFVVNSLSYHSTVVFHSTVFDFVLFWVASVLQFPAPMQIVVSMNMFRLVKLEITLWASIVTKQKVLTPWQRWLWYVHKWYETCFKSVNVARWMEFRGW